MKNKQWFLGAWRERFFALVTCLGVVLLFGLNLLFTSIGMTRSWYIDTTPEGLYTLSDAMIKECAFLDSEIDEDKPVKMIFCAEPDVLVGNTVTRVVYMMALKMQERFSGFSVEYVNVTKNPTAVAQYKTTSLSEIEPTDVILSYGDTYRITEAKSFWTIAEDKLWSFNGEYKLATLLLSLTAKERPVAYFIKGHGETYYDPDPTLPDSERNPEAATLYDLLVEAGLAVKSLDLETLVNAEREEDRKIPDDCAVLIINAPTEDFTLPTDKDHFDEFAYRTELEIIDRYLLERQGALMVAKDYTVTLPNLEIYLREWGFSFGSTQIRDEENSLEDLTNSNTLLIGEYNQHEGDYGAAIYGDFMKLTSAPRTILSDTGHITCHYGEGLTRSEDGNYMATRAYSAFLRSSAKAEQYAYDPLTGGYTARASEFGVSYDLAAICYRTATDSTTAESTYSFVFCAASDDFFSAALLGNTSYANYDITSLLVRDISRVDEYASMDLGGLSYNSSAFGGKQLYTTDIATQDTKIYTPALDVLKINYAMGNGTRAFFAVLVMLPPIAVLGVCIYMLTRRKYL